MTRFNFLEIVRKIVRVSVALALAMNAILIQGAFAQEGGDDESRLEEITVTATGSRIAQDGFQTPTPTTVLGSDLLDKQGMINVGEFVNQIPAVRDSRTADTTGLNFRAGGGGSFTNMRGLGANRTLILVDGQRVVANTPEGLVDMNLMPSLMLERSEVVTGGASAVYGSDAISGVVNLITRKDFVGHQVDMQVGIAEEGDNENYRLGYLGGLEFGETGHFMFALEHADSEGIGKLGEREFSNRAGGYVTGSGGVVYIVDDIQLSTETYGGLITAGPLSGTAFDASGTPFAFTAGNGYGNPGARVVEGGDNPKSFNYDAAFLRAPFTRTSALARVSYEFSPTLAIDATLNYANTEVARSTVHSRSALTINRDNPFIPQATQAAMDTAGVTSFRMGKILRNLGDNTFAEDNDLWRLTLSIDGELGNEWTYIANASYGHFTSNYDFTSRIDGAYPGDPAGTRRFLNAVDAVLDGSGNIVCRVNQVTVTSDCVPYNVFGDQPASDDVRNWVMGTQHTKQVNEQLAFSFGVNGAPFSTSAGDVALAAGIEYREESLDVTPDEAGQAGVFQFGNEQPTSGEASITEVYGEVLLPLVADKSGFQALDLHAAVRFADYETIGEVTTWKAGLNWEVNDSIRVRATSSLDIRAPNLVEALRPPTTSVNLVRGAPFLAGFWPIVRVGNPDLTQEEADTFSAGVVLTPEALPNFRVSLDYWDIQLDDAIVTLRAQDIVNGCFRTGTYCDAVEGGRVVGGPPPTALNPKPLITLAARNADSFHTTGYDLEIGYGFDLGAGELDIAALASYVTKFELTSDLGTFDRAGQVGNGIIQTGDGTPKLTGNLNINYSTENWGVLANIRVIGKSTTALFAEPGDVVGDTSVPATAFVNLGFDWTLGVTDMADVRVFAGIDNVFDEYAPREVNYQTWFGGANAYYSPVGRAYRLGVRFGF